MKNLAKKINESLIENETVKEYLCLKKEIEERLGSGEQMSNDEIMKLSSRMQEVIEELDEKEMIWLELNEKIL